MKMQYIFWNMEYGIWNMVESEFANGESVDNQPLADSVSRHLPPSTFHLLKRPGGAL